MPEHWLPNPAPYPPVPPTEWPPAPPPEEVLEGPDAPPDRPDAGDRWKVVLIVLAAGVVALLVAVASIALMRPRTHIIEASSSATTLNPPSTTLPAPTLTQAALDRELADLIPFVERSRGLKFDQRPTVTLLSTQRFAGAWQAYVDKYFVTFARHLQSPFEALRLSSGSAGDLATLTKQWMGSDQVAFYDPTTKTISVDTVSADSYLRFELVAALTESLDGQHFSLAPLTSTDGFGDPQFAMRTLLEGDSTEIALLWGGTLPFAEQQQLVQELTDKRRGSSIGSDVPAALRAWLENPSTDGTVLRDALTAAGGVDRLNAAFVAPPTGSADSMDPARYMSGPKPIVLTQPAVPSGAQTSDSGTLGRLMLRTSMEEQVNSDLMSAAMEAYWTDSSVAYTSDGKSCVAMIVAAAPGKDPKPLAQALAGWAKAIGGTSEAAIDAAHPDVVATKVAVCASSDGSGEAPADPGPSADTGGGSGI